VVIRPSSFVTRHSSGFTLIEILVVMSLIIVLASIGMTMYANSVKRAKEAVLKEDLTRMRSALDQYYADKQKYPATLQDLVEEKYIRAVPVDPFTNSADTWQTENADFEPGNATGQPGIYNVKSGAPDLAIDGTNYADW
jgi:general secretion pathway protein G